MTEENNEKPEKSPYDFKDPSQRMKEIISGDDSSDAEVDAVDTTEDQTEQTPEPVVERSPDPKPSAADDDDDAIGMKSVEDYIDEDLASVVARLTKEIRSLKQERQESSNAAKVDLLVDSLGDEWQPVFRDKANREKLNVAMKVIKTGYERSNLTVPDEREILSKALRAEFGEVKTSIEQEETQNKIDKRRSQMIARGSGRRTDSLSPKESAMRSVHKIMIDRGLYNG